MKKQFEVLYTRHKTQKTKTWHDGMVVIHNVKGVNRISLYKIDENGCKGELVEAFSSYSREINLSKVKFSGHLIEFMVEEVNERDGLEVGEGEGVDSTLKCIPRTTLTPKLSENSYSNESTAIKKGFVRPFKTPLVSVDTEVQKTAHVKTPKIISKMIPLSKISSRHGIIKTLEKIYTLKN